MRNATRGKASQRGIHTGEIFNIMLGAMTENKALNIIRNTIRQTDPNLELGLKNEK